MLGMFGFGAKRETLYQVRLLAIIHDRLTILLMLFVKRYLFIGRSLSVPLA